MSEYYDYDQGKRGKEKKGCPFKKKKKGKDTPY